MITKIRVKNFKKFEATLDLSKNVVFAGPNNSGKTSALQAVTLWNVGLIKWIEAKKASKAKKRTGVAINRKDLLSIPIPSAKQLWKDLAVRESKIDKGKQTTKNIKIEIGVEGFTNGVNWKLGFEFDYANSESIYCKVVNEDNIETALNEKIGLLPSMSGLASEEDILQVGSINARIGQGKTADVLRNLCWHVLNGANKEGVQKWKELKEVIKKLFGIDLNEPEYNNVTGKIVMTYNENGKEFDLSNGGRGFHQILLLFSYIYANQNSIILLDEPDAHLEILRQKEVFNILSDKLKKENSQLIIATHSEAVLNEAAEKSDIIAFIGEPHIVNNKSQLVKSLTTIGFEQYLFAKQKGWVIYLEGSTDLSILKEFAKVLNHPVIPYLEIPFIKYVTNQPNDAREHFYGLKEGVLDLKGVAIFDRIDKELRTNDLKEVMWQRREIENYLPLPEVIERYAFQSPKDLFSSHDPELMKGIINEETPPAALKDKNHSWWQTTKITDDFLDKIFKKYFAQKQMPILINKSDYYLLIPFAKPEELSPEIKEKLDIIYSIASKREKLM